MKYNTYWSIANVHWRSQDMFFCPSISKTVQLVLFLSFQLWLHHLVHADPPYESCNNTDEFAENGVFQSNLDQLLYSFKGNASALKFYNTTVGNFPDRVYGLFLCYMYVSNDACHECIATASQTVKNLCARKYEAVVWGEYCQLRYSNKSFFGSLDVADYTSQQNPRNISDPDQFRSDVNKTLTNLTNSSPFDYSDGIYATGNGVFPPNETIYALVQCTQDLSPDRCKECLTKSIAQVQNCCYFAMGARLLSRSCYLRYELYPINDWATGPHGSTQNPGGFKNKGMIAILATGSAAVLLGLLVFCYAMRKQTMKSNNVLPRESEIVSQEVQLEEIGEPKTMDFLNRNLQGRYSLNPQEFPFIDMETINTATEYFAEPNKLGQGSFGPVYKGILSDGKEVAVKRLSELSDQGSDEFINEVLLILKLQHKNLVRLVGFCAHGEEKLLIYEYMPNNSLDFFLTDPTKRAQLNWSRRLSIINGIARGLLYLHQDSRLRIIHRDLKPSNVLLDKDMNPKISDFGMARIFGGSDGEANTARVAGTYGYMAPEYAMEGLYSFKSDVFSFGVLLLETITGRRNFVGFDLSKRTPSLIAYAWNFWIDGRGAELMDPLLTDSCNADEFLRYMHIGLLCVQEDAYDRPTMSTVAVMLKSETITLCQPERPAFSVGRFTDQYETCFNNLSMNNLTVSDVLPR